MCNVLCRSWTRLSKWVIFNLFVTLFYNILSSVCVPEQNFAFYLFACFFCFFNLVCIFEIELALFHVNSVFYIFFPALVLGDFSKRSVTAVWGCQKCFISNNMGELKGDGETMRSLCGMLVSGGLRTRCRKGWGELRKEEEEVECRG